LSLNFYDFSMNLYPFYKLAVFENKRKRKRHLASRPLERFGGLQMCPWPEPGTEEAVAIRFPASELAGGEGEVGERLEEIESYSEVIFSRSGTGGRGVSGGEQGRRWW
jgi:hypothetical protein